VVARAIDAEMKKSGDECVYLHTEHLNPRQLRDQFPQINERLLSLKMDFTKEPVPVVPAAHYMCGGIQTDIHGKSTIEGLYVAGETACTGVHGANRLASNSLLEALVFSRQVYLYASKYIKEQKIFLPTVPLWNDEGTFDHEEWVLISHDLREIQRLMWDYVGIVRSTERLERAGRRIGLIQEEIETFYKRTRVTHELLELRNLACIARLIIRSALFRKESRGLHFTTDYPERDEKNWVGDTVIQGEKTFLQALPGISH
jgi:L-aspartate oxidase